VREKHCWLPNKAIIVLELVLLTMIRIQNVGVLTLLAKQGMRVQAVLLTMLTDTARKVQAVTAQTARFPEG
jgi:hypothetical protein